MVSAGRYRDDDHKTQKPKNQSPYYFGTYKWGEISNFFLGGISLGGGEEDDDGNSWNQLVKPAEVGMMYGLWRNTAGLPKLRDIRNLSDLTTKWGTRLQEIGTVTLVVVRQNVEIGDPTQPQWTKGNQGFEDYELYVVPMKEFLGIKRPFLSCAYQRQHDVTFDYRKGFGTGPDEDWVTFGAGGQVTRNLYFTVLAIPKKREIRADFYLRFLPVDLWN